MKIFAPSALEAPRDGVGLQVRALHLVAQVEQHFGDAAHAAAADADEMDAMDAAHAVVHAGAPAGDGTDPRAARRHR